MEKFYIIFSYLHSFTEKKVKEVGFGRVDMSHFLGPLANVKANLDDV